MRRILVIGATGNVGREVVSQLPAGDVQIRALARNPATAGLPPHVEVVRGDLGIPESLDEGLEGGIDAAFVVWAAPPAAAAPALERIVKHARHIVFLSSPHQTAHPFFQRPQPNLISKLHADIERLIIASGRQWTFVRPGMFAANASFWWAPQIRVGDVVRWPLVNAPTAPIHERDIAAVAVRALTEDGHAGAEYLVTGPQSLTQAEQISIVGDVLRRKLRVEEISKDDARREMLAFGPLAAVNMLLAAWEGALEQPALITSTVAEVTGAPARTFRQWATDHAADFLPRLQVEQA